MILPTVNKVDPLCPVFGQCGGCNYQDISYADELALKERNFRTLITSNVDVDPNVFAPIVASPREYHYRNTVDLKLVRTKDQKVLIGFSPKERKYLLPIDGCPIATQQISDFIPGLTGLATQKLTPKYRQANIVVRTGDDGRVLWGGIGRHSLSLGEYDYLWIEVEGRKMFYSLDTFIQANRSILPKVFEVLKSFNCWGQDVIFYDLYGGVGLFTIGMVDYYSKAILIEDNAFSTKLAWFNASHHKFYQVSVINGRVEEKLQECLDGQNTGRQVAMIDPPRAGLSDVVRNLLINQRKIKDLFYLSCSPESLARDLKDFVGKGWIVERIVPFDFFPKTDHLEVLTKLKSP